MYWTEATWWWEFGLDGIVSGLVGGLVTGAAVVATIRHERNERVKAGQEAAMQDLRERVSELHAFTVRSIFVPHEVAALDAWAAWIGETYSRVLAIEVRAKRLAPVLASEMRAVQDHVTDAFDRRPVPTEVDGDEMHAVKHNIRVITQAWLAEPESLTPKLGPALAAARQEMDSGHEVP